MLLQGMPDLRKHDPKKYLDSLHVSCSYTSIVWCENGAACTVCSVLYGLLKRQENEQQNNVPSPKNNAAAGYKGPVKIELLKGGGRLINIRFFNETKSTPSWLC